MGMKKILAGALALMTAAPLLLAGCADKKNAVTYDEYNYDLSEYVKLDKYKGIEIEDYTYEITDEDIQNQVLMARSNYATATETSNPAALTDQLNIDYDGYMDGETFSGGSDTDCDMTLGAGQFIDGFEAGLIGAKTGDTVTLELSFPDPYTSDPSLSGKPVQFVVTVNHVYEQELPEYTDYFVKQYYGYDTTALFETGGDDVEV